VVQGGVLRPTVPQKRVPISQIAMQLWSKTVACSGFVHLVLCVHRFVPSCVCLLVNSSKLCATFDVGIAIFSSPTILRHSPRPSSDYTGPSRMPVKVLGTGQFGEVYAARDIYRGIYFHSISARFRPDFYINTAMMRVRLRAVSPAQLIKRNPSSLCQIMTRCS
jgi:hypothetical protein